ARQCSTLYPRQAPLTYLLASRRTSDGAVMKMDNLLRRADVIKALRNIGDLSVGELKQTGSDLKGLAKDVPNVQRERKVGGSEDSEGRARSIFAECKLEGRRYDRDVGSRVAGRCVAIYDESSRKNWRLG